MIANLGQVLLLLLYVNSALGLVMQASVPVILSSHKVSPGMYRYQEDYELGSVLSFREFSEIAKELLGRCNSDAYVFVNQPGISTQDLIDNQRELANLQRYLHASSTALKFEQVEVLPHDAFDELISEVKSTCHIDREIRIYGNDTDTFEPYIDNERRAIRIDFPPLPENRHNRSSAIADYDKNLRTILAQIPSPHLTIIYTSLAPGVDVAQRSDVSNKVEIYPEIFLDPARSLEQEKNDNILDEPPVVNVPQPKYSGMSSKYASVFDQKFIAENFGLIRMIITMFIAFIILQTIWPDAKRLKFQKKKWSRRPNVDIIGSIKDATIS